MMLALYRPTSPQSAVAPFMRKHVPMAAKARRARLTNLKRSFVVTIAGAASLGGCAGVHSDDDGSATMAGSGGAGSGGAGGVSGASGVGGAGGSYIATNPPFIDTACPIVEPEQGASCTATEPCTYDQPIADPCFPSSRTIAICQDGQWVVATSTLLPELACNPPPPELDSGLPPGTDEDAGR
jgi:hypothetical protein